MILFSGMRLLKPRKVWTQLIISLLAAAIAILLHRRAGTGRVVFDNTDIFGPSFAPRAAATDYETIIHVAWICVIGSYCLYLIVTFLRSRTFSLRSFGYLFFKLFVILLFFATTQTEVANFAIEPRGFVRSPDEVSENSSFYVTIDLDTETVNRVSKIAEKLGTHTGASDVRLNIDDAKANDVIEAELQAPGVVIDGEHKQQAKLGFGKFSYRWLCRVGTDPRYRMAVQFRLIRPNNDPVPIGSADREVKVNTTFHVPRWVLVGGQYLFGMGSFLQIVLVVRAAFIKPKPSEQQPPSFSIAD